jgi:hypothetical protein
MSPETTRSEHGLTLCPVAAHRQNPQPAQPAPHRQADPPAIAHFFRSLLDPDKVTACADDRYETIDAYDQDHPVSMGGLISRVAFKGDHTLVFVRVLDEETCAFCPIGAAWRRLASTRGPYRLRDR